jgi:hypothetical protein
MSQPRSETVSVTTASDGTVTAYTQKLTGLLHSIAYVKDGTTPFDNTVDFTITNEVTGESLWTESNITASKTVRPRGATHTAAGAAAVYATGGEGVLDKIALANARVKIAIAQGGSAKLGSFVVTVE